MIQAFSFLLVGVAFSVVGELLLKRGVDAVRQGAVLDLWPIPDLVSTLFRVFTNPIIIVGFAFVFAASIFWLAVLSRIELSLAYPMLSISYVIVVLLSWLVFREDVSFLRLAGTAVICGGVALVGFSYRA